MHLVVKMRGFVEPEQAASWPCFYIVRRMPARTLTTWEHNAHVANCGLRTVSALLLSGTSRRDISVRGGWYLPSWIAQNAPCVKRYTVGCRVSHGKASNAKYEVHTKGVRPADCCIAVVILIVETHRNSYQRRSVDRIVESWEYRLLAVGVSQGRYLYERSH